VTPAPPPAEAPGGAAIVWYVAAALCIWSFGYTAMRGSDLWWHIAGGRWMVENGTLWVGDPFSFTAAGKRWLNDSWLSDVQLYFWMERFGVEALAYWKWGLMVVTWLVLLRVVWRLSGDATSSFVALLLGLGIAGPFLDVRPQLYSFLGWALLLDLCLREQRPPRWLPLVYLFWVNLHAGFLLGFITLPLLLAPHFLAARGQERREVLVLGALCVAVCLINPNGLEVVVRPLRYAFDSSSPFRSLGEWLPPFRRGGIQSPLLPYGIAVLAAAAAVWGWELLTQTRNPRSALPLLLAALTLAMALRSRRFVPFFAMTQALVVAPALARLIAEPLRRLPAYAPAAAALALGIWWMSALPLRSYAFDRLTARSEFPLETCEFIKVNELSGKVFAYYNWGGFVQLCAHGRLKVYIDGRADQLYADDTFRQYLVVLNEKPGWERIVERSEADYVLWPLRQSTVPTALVKSGKWRIIYQDFVSMLLARSDLTLPPFKPTPDSPYRDVTLALGELRAGRAHEAKALFERALEVDPYLMPACVGVCRSQALAGEFAAAHATVERCNRLMPDAQQATNLHAFVENLRVKQLKAPK
jgi:hypothetical protein